MQTSEADVDGSAMTPTQVEWLAERLPKTRERFRDASIQLPVDSHKRVRKYAFDQEVTLSAVMVDAIEAWLDAREGRGPAK
jgi:hypothetical protein